MRPNCKGFSLVEVLVVALIIIIITAAILSVFLVGKNTWSIGSTQISVQQALRNAMDRMVQELAFTSGSQVSISPAADSITFCKPQSVDSSAVITWSAPIQYSLIAGQILRTTAGTSSVLANDITLLQFISLNPRAVQIRLTGAKSTLDGRNITYSLTSQAHYRNEQ